MKKCAMSIITTLFFCITPTVDAVPLQSHRAVYKLSLINATPESSIEDIQGNLTLELQKRCDGWFTQQFSSTTIYDKNNQQMESDWGYVIWESDDHNQLRFNTYRKVDGEVTKEYRGNANLTKGVAEYTVPDTMSLKIPTGTLFPIAHLKETIKTARNGGGMLSKQIFDGSAGAGVTGLNTYIGKNENLPQMKEQHALSNIGVYPIQIAIFEPNNQGAIPDYETYQELSDSGIVNSYTVIVDGFRVKGTLERIELLPSEPCTPS